jgi:hypothetical protein
MNYRNGATKEIPKPMTRALRRLWTVVCYDGDPDDPATPLLTKTCIAWNQSGAIRMCGKVAEPPEAKCFVTWPQNKGDPIYEIYSTAGPSDVEVHADLMPKDDDEWDF